MTEQIVTRTADFKILEARNTGDGLTLEGYAAVFNSPTEIDSWEGRFIESIAPGAFKRTLEHRTPVLQFDHGQHPMIGGLPIGTIQTLREDDHGLFVRARLAANWLVEPVRDAIRSGAVNGMSFRFVVRDDDWSDDGTKRVIREVELRELGPVVFPAYEATTVAVRSAHPALADLVRVLEQSPEMREGLAALLYADDVTESRPGALDSSGAEEDLGTADGRAGDDAGTPAARAGDDDAELPDDRDARLQELRDRVARFPGLSKE